MKKGKYAKTTKLSKVLTMVLAMVLVAGISVGGTLAWLTATSGDVTNTFTVGKIELNLDESVLKDDNTLDTEADRIKTNNNYKIVPGGKSPKDPILTVKAGSEECWVYVCIDNEVVLNNAPVATPNISTTDWTAIGTNGTKTLYRYKSTVNALSAAQPLTVFTEVVYDSGITETTIVGLEGKTIKIQGYAHQSANTDQATADAAAHAKFGTTASTT